VNAGDDPAAPAAKARRRTILLSSLGEIVEWFDFMIYLSLAPILAKVFFPSSDGRTSLFATLGVFAAAYLARPLGSLLFGRIGDRSGRKQALVASALVMSGAKLFEGSLPSYDSIGIAAAALFVVARLISGFSIGGEFTGTYIMLFETGSTGRRALTTSLANVMAGTGILLASGLITLLMSLLSSAQMQDWGWRIPFYVGSLVGLIALAIRLRVRETPLFEQLRNQATIAQKPLLEALREQPRAILIAFAMSSYVAISYYLVVAFVPTYLQSFVGMDHVSALTIATLAGLLNIVLIPWPALASDRFGRKPVMIAASGGFALLGYPLFLLLSSGDFAATLAGALLFVALAAGFVGAANTAAVERFPTRVRYSGFALGYNVGAAIFGGTTPLLAAWLIHTSGSLMAPSAYLILASLAVLVVIWRLKETFRSTIA
jgi:MFS transporter, MHS family, proline/betaine transporter